eukprot:CAMPEP_0194030674 /NCGR_PEP_ID=MMETSP0009_2-20130614/4061_1 /TAXON_ID=210454 /ORGANISM="Grammatophora oceanica, Strain CCMP 410" /LENGTH=307 /DNA_ID=CAMNT_0038670655 /DNA_START=11 /DNA_END=934 /DNA_ORIENTATION=+
MAPTSPRCLDPIEEDSVAEIQLPLLSSQNLRKRSSPNVVVTNRSMASELQVAAAVASMSMADVDMTKVNPNDGKAKLGLWETVTYGGALASVVLSAFTLVVVSGSPITYVAMVWSLLVAPVACAQRYQLSRMDTFRDVHNALRQDVNRLQEENNDLELQNDRLQEQANQVKDLEAGLQDVLEKQGTNVNAFVKSVKENGEILKEIEKNLMYDVMQNVMSTIMRADLDGDFQIDPEEVTILILRLKQLPGVEDVDEAAIHRMLEQRGNGLDKVMAFVKDLMADKEEPKPGMQRRKSSLIKVSTRDLTF